MDLLKKKNNPTRGAHQNYLGNWKNSFSILRGSGSASWNEAQVSIFYKTLTENSFGQALFLEYYCKQETAETSSINLISG
jgi:hypothetical protein